MIILNGKKFAKNEKEFTDSLFEKSGTCVGYYKQTKANIFLLDANKERIGAINKHGCLINASKLDNGKYLYSFMDIKLLGEVDRFTENYKIAQERAMIYNNKRLAGLL